MRANAEFHHRIVVIGHLEALSKGRRSPSHVRLCVNRLEQDTAQRQQQEKERREAAEKRQAELAAMSDEDKAAAEERRTLDSLNPLILRGQLSISHPNRLVHLAQVC